MCGIFRQVLFYIVQSALKLLMILLSIPQVLGLYIGVEIYAIRSS